ncbi:hypothetical protein KKH23_01955 [Patescibacteria group bacterium]|nr:hypothetical protein [Patescibacteria group bacterium]MBU0777002.1 hypothetical protein [Patescibacteria group bacterium]MBU0845945.1 hypothetical protein [Patescibacteria group bacterium]MBU0923032.1 hypothetical protein [Patescibacteria group bacterium]MBU1844600.1 hypothetical protein [Patescibacteria group bacterium]
MTEQPTSADTLQEAIRSFIDSEFFSHVDSKDFEVRKSHILQNTEITPKFVRNSYHYYLKLSTDVYLDRGKTLQRNATNLALLKVMDERLPAMKREITLYDELSFFRYSLIAEIHSKVLNIESLTAASGNFTDIDYLRDFLDGEIKSLNRLTIMETSLSPSVVS